MPTAFSYIRFSTPEQSKGDSLRRQTELTEAYCRQHNLTLDTSITLRDLGVSAFHGKNADEGALGAFLQACENEQIPNHSYLIVESLDRLSRDEVLNALQLFIRIINTGTTIVTLQPSQEFNKDNIDPYKLIIAITIMARAHEESSTKSLRRKQAWKKQREDAANGKIISPRCPSWLRFQDGKFIKIQAKVAVIKKCFDMAANGYGLTSIAKDLTAC